MRKVAIFVLGAVLVGLNVAQAMDNGGVRPAGDTGSREDHHRRDRGRTLLNCRFVGIGIPLPPPLPGMPPMKGAGKDPTLGAPGVAPIGAPGVFPGGPVAPGIVPGAFPGAYPGLGPVGGPLPGPVMGAPVPPPLGVGPMPLLNNCAAVARLVDRNHSRDREDDDWDDDRFFRNEFAVSCEGVPIYADTAVRSRIDGFEFLTGVIGDPILKLVRDHDLYDFDGDDRDEHHRRDRRSAVVPAWLAIRGRILEGFCAMERERRHDGDHAANASTLN